MQSNSRIGKNELITRGVACLIAVVFSLFIYWFNINTVKSPLVNTMGRSFEKATVVEIIKDNLAEDGNRYGNQQVILK